MKRISIETGGIRLSAVLDDSDTSRALYDILPLTGNANVWGDEIYFTIPLHLDVSKDARREVDLGDLAYWPPGDAFCIFFGPTPVSPGELPMAYSPVNVFGRIQGDAGILKKVTHGEQIKVSKEE